VLVEGLIRRFRYLDETIAIVLALVAVKLLLEDTYKVGPIASLAVVALAFAIGIVASLIGDKREAARSGGDGLAARDADGDDDEGTGESEREQSADRQAPAERR